MSKQADELGKSASLGPYTAILHLHKLQLGLFRDLIEERVLSGPKSQLCFFFFVLVFVFFTSQPRWCSILPLSE